MERVLIEAAGQEPKAREVLNGHSGAGLIRRYEFAAMRDSIKRGENPVAASLMLDFIGVADKKSHILWWVKGVDKIVLYTDFGTSQLMQEIMDHAASQTPPVPVEMREIGYDKCL